MDVCDGRVQLVSICSYRVVSGAPSHLPSMAEMALLEEEDVLLAECTEKVRRPVNVVVVVFIVVFVWYVLVR